MCVCVCVCVWVGGWGGGGGSRLGVGGGGGILASTNSVSVRTESVCVDRVVDLPSGPRLDKGMARGREGRKEGRVGVGGGGGGHGAGWDRDGKEREG